MLNGIGVFIMNFLIKALVTGLGAGYTPRGPGTVGSIVGVALFWAVARLTPLNLLIFLAIFTLFSIWSASIAEKMFGEKDSSKIVIDEICGILFTFIGHPFNWKIILVGFLLFRIFDIAKPFPIRTIDEKLGGGLGVVLDDILAGIYANLSLTTLIYIGGRIL